MAATQRVMMRVGPRELTLAEIGAEAGVTAGALVQRFGSKRGLMLELAKQFAESVPEMYAQMRAASAFALAACALMSIAWRSWASRRLRWLTTCRTCKSIYGP